VVAIIAAFRSCYFLRWCNIGDLNTRFFIVFSTFEIINGMDVDLIRFLLNNLTQASIGHI
jgi:hypothetical protein